VLEEQFDSFPKAGMTLHFRVEGIEDIYQALLNEGLDILLPTGGQTIRFQGTVVFDPDGYLVVLAETSVTAGVIQHKKPLLFGERLFVFSSVTPSGNLVFRMCLEMLICFLYRGKFHPAWNI
jgi:hypothetical protein